MTAFQSKEIARDCVLTMGRENGRWKLIGQRILPGKRAQPYLGRLTDCCTHAIKGVVAHRRGHKNHLALLFKILDDAVTIFFHGTGVTPRG